MKIVVYGEPTPKGRPKIAMRGKYPTVYTPKATREAEDGFMAQAIKQKPETPLEGPLSVSIGFYKIKPKSMPKYVKHWTKKPDLDNMIKLVLDALNKVFFQDDAQIVELICTKQYDEVPRTEVIIRKV
jgi:Holliday junction resolvase RusA-like endonuclease